MGRRVRQRSPESPMKATTKDSREETMPEVSQSSVAAPVLVLANTLMLQSIPI